MVAWWVVSACVAFAAGLVVGVVVAAWFDDRTRVNDEPGVGERYAALRGLVARKLGMLEDELEEFIERAFRDGGNDGDRGSD